ncbi:hypothetical protein ACH42_15775 [Endozoicomonas sp. (ex Bugula neritina AB1)]|nr:hypothetical protein ACH42_15775 [Endozoicomonas sp. (ex Bugula neritina AB1)]
MDSKVFPPSPTNLWLAYLAKGGSMKELRGIDQAQLDVMYAIAYGRYNSALYNDSLLIFKHLCLLDHINAKYFLGLGVTQVALHQYAQAAATLNHAEKLNNKDPRASLAMAGCFVEMRKLPLAKQALKTAIKRAKQSKKWEQELIKAKQLMVYVN